MGEAGGGGDSPLIYKSLRIEWTAIAAFRKRGSVSALQLAPNETVRHKKKTSYLKIIFIFFYYIDTSVLVENIPLVKFIKTTSGTRVVIFQNLKREFIDDVISDEYPTGNLSCDS